MTNPFFSWLGGEAAYAGRWDGPRFRQFFAGPVAAGFEREHTQRVETGFEAELALENETGRVRVRGQDLAGITINLRAHLFVESDDAADSELEALKAGIHVEGNHISIR